MKTTPYRMELIEFTRFNFSDGFIQNIDGPVHLHPPINMSYGCLLSRGLFAFARGFIEPSAHASLESCV